MFCVHIAATNISIWIIRDEELHQKKFFEKQWKSNNNSSIKNNVIHCYWNSELVQLFWVIANSLKFIHSTRLLHSARTSILSSFALLLLFLGSMSTLYDEGEREIYRAPGAIHIRLLYILLFFFISFQFSLNVTQMHNELKFIHNEIFNTWHSSRARASHQFFNHTLDFTMPISPNQFHRISKRFFLFCLQFRKQQTHFN